jgi:excisionase family DNA binding protein
MSKLADSNTARLTFTCQETADAAHISEGMVRKLIREKKLEAVYIGRAVRIPRHAVLLLCGVPQ